MGNFIPPAPPHDLVVVMRWWNDGKIRERLFSLQKRVHSTCTTSFFAFSRRYHKRDTCPSPRRTQALFTSGTWYRMSCNGVFERLCFIDYFH